MAHSPLGEIEELTLCSCCRRAFDEAERAPKLLACKHHFCLACARGVLGAGGGGGVCCVHCWKRTELPQGRADRLPTHAPVLALARRLQAAALPPPPEPAACRQHALPALWCVACGARGCRACVEHAAHAHALRPAHEAGALLARDTRALRHDLQRLAARRRDFLLRALEAATALKMRLEAELGAPSPAASPAPHSPGSGADPLAAATAECERLRARHADALLQARLDDVIRAAGVPLDAELVRRALAALSVGEAGAAAAAAPGGGADEARDPVLFLANYCTAQLCARHCSAPALPNGSAPPSPLVRAPAGSAFPLFFLDVEVEGAAWGRVVIEVRSDVAPRMARNFGVLATGELGVGYRGCSVFQCWENESVITGDFELNNGRGGRSAFEESYFMPDETRLGAVRGAVGMRRSQKRHDNLGLVGSQFRIVLREMRGFTAIFGFVADGLELVERLARTGDSAGKPHCSILIADCGKLD